MDISEVSDYSLDVDDYDEILPIQKSYEVEFRPMTHKELQAIQVIETEQVAMILGCKLEVAAVLLRSFKWNKDRLIEQYMDDEKKTCKDANVVLSDSPKLLSLPGFSCDICYSEENDLYSLALSCQHRFCINCYEKYLVIKIAEEGESRFLSCPGYKCNLSVNEAVVSQIVPEKILEKYKTLLLKSYVDDQSNLKWCPSPNCDNAIECKVTTAQLDRIIPTVTCAEGHKFCFGCLLQDHQPSLCSTAKLWLKKCADDSETANWISVNTKECSKCNSTIEKNGGCNHMTCKKCKYEFCWICQGIWSTHGTAYYTCNRFDASDAVTARDAQAKSRTSLERYLHYYNRYANHDQSAKLDKDLYIKTEMKMDTMMKESTEFSWIQVQFLKSAVDVLLKSRQTLMWTYCLAYYLARTDNATALFEDNQRDLEMAVEGLSELLEMPITADNTAEIRTLVLDKMEYGLNLINCSES